MGAVHDKTMLAELPLDPFGSAISDPTLQIPGDKNQISTLNEKVQRVYKEFSRYPSKKNDPLTACKLYYKIQTMHTIGSKYKAVEVPVYMTKKLHTDWKPHVKNSISEINLAAPGLCLFITENRKAARVIVDTSEDGCYTRGSIQEKETCYVCFDDNWTGSWKGTSTHELLHALGMEHEMQRKFASLYVNITCKDPDRIQQYEEDDAVKGITRFDPLSILMYSESDNLHRKSSGDPVWKLKKSKRQPKVMSELDKVSLNLLYRPCRRDNYNPEVKGLVHYCGRQTTSEHNSPSISFTDGSCGPHNGPNCPACRVLKVPGVDDQIGERWQGWSGFFYCGSSISGLKKKTERRQNPSTGKTKTFEKDGMCGPDIGYPCNACGQLLDSSYDINNTYGDWPVAD